MRFPHPLVHGRLVRRYKRFLCDVELDDGTVVTAHCPNPGSMLGGLADPGLEVWLAPNHSPTAKLRWRWELLKRDGHLIGINTNNPNGIVADAIADGRIPELAGYDSLRREVKYGRNSRIDILMEAEGRPPAYVEVKNVHLRRTDGAHADAAEFPDSVTKRGAKHLEELADMVAGGARAVMVYLVQRGDCTHFRVAENVDPGYAAGLNAALTKGVEALCYDCSLSLDGVELAGPLPVVPPMAAGRTLQETEV